MNDTEAAAVQALKLTVAQQARRLERIEKSLRRALKKHAPDPLSIPQGGDALADAARACIKIARGEGKS